jgi:hypothetical protein
LRSGGGREPCARDEEHRDGDDGACERPLASREVGQRAWHRDVLHLQPVPAMRRDRSMKMSLATSVASTALLLTSPVVATAGGATAPPPGSSAQLNVGSGAPAQLNVGSGAAAQLGVGSRLAAEGEAVPGQLRAPELGERELREPDLHFAWHRELRLAPPPDPDAERQER